ncbi:unnamed protein product [Boreogadus saida]
MDLFKEFVASPSVELLKGLKAEELWRVVTHYNLTPDVMQGRSKKKEVFAAVHMGLIDQGVLEDDETEIEKAVKTDHLAFRSQATSSHEAGADQTNMILLRLSHTQIIKYIKE